MKKPIKIVMLSIVILLCASFFTACSMLDSCAGGSSGNIQPKSVTVTLNPNGGTVEKLTLIGEKGSAMELPAPERTGYTFDAWYNGWDVISNTAFPDGDMTLTARYYAGEDSERTVNTIPTELNKVYDGSISWDQSWFSAADWQGVEYLKKNSTVEITVTATLERLATTSFGGSVWYKLTGANTADIIATSPKLYKNDTYEAITLSGEATAKVLVGTSSAVINLRIDSDLGSQHLRSRNISVSIDYTEKAGTLV